MRYHVIFDGPPGPVSGRFLRLENDHGASLSTTMHSQWRHSGSATQALELGLDDFIILDEESRFIEREDYRGHGIGGGEWFERNGGEWALVVEVDARDFDAQVAALAQEQQTAIVITYDPLEVSGRPEDTPWSAEVFDKAAGGATAYEAFRGLVLALQERGQALNE